MTTRSPSRSLRRTTLLSALLLSGVLTPALFAANDASVGLVQTSTPAAAPAAPIDSPADAAAADTLNLCVLATQKLYAHVSAGMVRVRFDVNASTLLPPPARKEFEEFRREQMANFANQGNDAKPPASGPSSRPAPRDANHDNNRPNNQVLLRRFLDQKLKATDDPVQQNKLRIAIMRLQQPIGETTGIILDTDGNTLLFGGYVKDGIPDSLRVTAPDGSEFGARYIGSHPSRGIAIIKIDKFSTGIASPLGTSPDAPLPGTPLLAIGATSGATSLAIVPGRIGRKSNDDRFAIPSGDDRGATYFFDTHGNLAAIGADRFALPLRTIKDDIAWIIANHKDVAPRQLGVTYSPVSPITRRANRILANRPAVVVDNVVTGSPADRAGLEKGDIVLSIDKRPIWQMPQIQWDIATRTDSVPIGIVRSNTELTLQLPIDDTPEAAPSIPTPTPTPAPQ